ncbi:DoxX-like protein [Mucilaginibacter gracilis]|uniref:DoxX-like protein n=1 Tax=Mucilaginibacter gracilis TaxID=423350 RepID=A0A495ITL3_9SPHI|nr:DoxX family protein [Mucilaginibacter gracilis]RKR80115.1 DoxX-like protein [Mucilaginibacter gracilis]
MKIQKITYWIATGLLVLGMLATFANYFFNPDFKKIFAHLGFPDWFRVELGIAKLLGAFAVAIPAVPARVKEWAYFGFLLSFSSAVIAHYNAGDPVFNMVAPLIMLLVLVVSYISFHKVILQKKLT